MKVLVLGGTGMLGSMLVRHLSSVGHDVTFTTRNKVPSWLPLKTKVSMIKMDASEMPSVAGYDYIINAIGAIPQVSWNTFDYYYLNSVFPWKVSTACAFEGVKFIHVSSDCVFSGKKTTGYLATDACDIEDDDYPYGMSKFFGEPLGAIVLRTSIIGPAEKHVGLFERVRNFPEPTMGGYQNHIWSGVTTLFLSQFIDGLMTKPEIEIPPKGGLIQIASKPVSKCQLVELINEVFECGKTINPTTYGTDINRTLIPTMGYAPDIHEQLVMLKNWMKANE